MDPHSAIHQGQVYSILVHVPHLYFLLPTAASFPHLSSSTSSCCPPLPLLLLPSPVPACLPLFLPVLPSGPFLPFSYFFLLLFLFLSLLLFFTLLLQLRSHISHDGSSGPPTSPSSLPLCSRSHNKKTTTTKKTPTAPKEDRYSCSLLKIVFCPPPPNPFPSVDSSKWVVSASFLFLFPSLSSHFL